MHTSSEWLDLKAAEREYPYSRRTWWKLISEGRLSAYRPFGRKVLLRRSDIEKLLASTRVNADLDAIVNETLAELGGNRK